MFASLSLLAVVPACSSDPAAPSDAALTPETSVTDASGDAGPGPDATPPADAQPSGDTGPVGVPDAMEGACGISGDVAGQLRMLATSGWASVNRSRSMMMHGCAGASRPQDCLQTVPAGTDENIGANASAIMGSTLRVLYSTTTRSNYWTRISADGRFVGRGTRVHDLARDAEMPATGAMYDPAFFPDNSGFMYQPGGRMCPMSMLTEGMPTAVPVTGASSQCVGSSVGLYQHVSASLDGSDYWATAAGTAAFDDGGHSATLRDPNRNEVWSATAATPLSLMVNTGAGFMAMGSRSLRLPFQGDAVISRSSRLLLARFVDEAGAFQGYVLHTLQASHTGAAIMATTQEIARYCVQGNKPVFSYDERYIAFHHYIGGGTHADEDARELGFADANDAGFAEYRTRGASNIYILDLLTGRKVRVTNMRPGQYALYPDFRSDNWMYFLVRTVGSSAEHVVASDAAFRM